jgi:hypothetical protein
MSQRFEKGCIVPRFLRSVAEIRAAANEKPSAIPVGMTENAKAKKSQAA